LGFNDQSSEGLNPQFLAEEPELVSVWRTSPGSFFSEPPFATASVRRRTDHWEVAFVPANMRGDEAAFFVNSFSRCITLHSPSMAVEITSERFLDLR
jgi:hypothetical protein